MKLLNVHIISAPSCGGLLDGFRATLRDQRSPLGEHVSPVCLIGPNGAGKSQFLQIIAEIFQSAWYACAREQERELTNSKLCFEVEYQIHFAKTGEHERVRISRPVIRSALNIEVERDGKWIRCPVDAEETRLLLPSIVVGYTSGENETLSLPFLVSRSAYADEVAKNARTPDSTHLVAPEPRLMLIDYSTHFEVLIANLLLGNDDVRDMLLSGPELHDIQSFRCVIRLAHSAAPTASARAKELTGRSKQVDLTEELFSILESLKRSATTWSHDEATDSYTFDYFVSNATREAFKFFFKSPSALYSAFHKFAMLNDLALSREARNRIRNAVEERRFASRLPEPPDDDKIFCFEQVTFQPRQSKKARRAEQMQSVDYASLSDGEHQLVQILGVFAMIDQPNAFFLMDEPESHFNPRWRVLFAKRLLKVRAASTEGESSPHQEVVLTTHAPFLASDLRRESILIFRRSENLIKASHPDEETFGTTFDRILDICFEVSPPISALANAKIDELFKSNDLKKLEAEVPTLGPSADKALLMGRLQKLRNQSEE